MDLEKEIRSIKKRNARVEKDKAWETSLTRRLCICVLTYLVVVIGIIHYLSYLGKGENAKRYQQIVHTT